MDQITFEVYRRALWAMPAILEAIDLDDMLVRAREWGSETDIDLILALRSVKGEQHRQ
jgi:hypothetical protein